MDIILIIIIILVPLLAEIGVKSNYKKYLKVNNTKKLTGQEVARQILESSGVASSLASRSVFEQSISKFVNSEVVDISTNGGTAVQQSVFGYEGYQNVADDSIVQYNDGNHLEWDTDNGSMEVLLSIKFFKTVVPP